MKHRPMDNERVSALWYPLLKDLREVDGIVFNVNEGRRTRARQRELIAEKGLFHPTRNPTGAAAVSGFAPHIRDDPARPDHAIDFDNAEGVIRGAAARGVTLVRTVSSEPWHVEIKSVAQVRAYNERRARRIAKLRRKVRATKAALARWRKKLNERLGR
jgi:hypothetical protein